MKIDSLIWKESPTIDAYSAAYGIENELLEYGFLVVLKEGCFQGVLVADDIIEKQHNLVIDCLRPKPTAHPEDDIKDIFKLMKLNKVSVLAVLINYNFIGVITQTAIIDYLSNQGEAFEKQIATHAQELMRLNTKLRAEIVERKAAEKRAKAASQAKTNFLANISHEIRTPLHIIIGFSQLLEEHATTMQPDQVQNHLLKIQTAGHHLLALVTQILDLSMIEINQIKLQPTTITPMILLENLVALFQHEARKKGNSLQFKCDETIGVIQADLLRLRQVLLNLLSNANKFTENGEIFLCAQQPEEKKGITFSVEDTGIGIPENEIHNLFEPFFQAESAHSRNQGGAGLGLSICKKLVEKMGGKIQVENHPGEGCRFYFTLNVASAEHEQIIKQCPPTHHPIRPAAILLIEDDPLSRMLMEELLTLDGHHVTAYDNAQDSFQALKKQTFDLILSDLRIPDQDGLSIIRHIRALPEPDKSTIPILVLTADIIPKRLQACLKAGANAIITKPMELQKLRSAIACMQAGESFTDAQTITQRHHPPSHTTLNTETLTRTLASLGQKRMITICQKFQETSQKTIQDLECALLNQDQEVIIHAAHLISSSASHLGMKTLVDLSYKLEEQARDQVSTSTTLLIEKFIRNIKDAQVHLNYWMNTACQLHEPTSIDQLSTA